MGCISGSSEMEKEAQIMRLVADLSKLVYMREFTARLSSIKTPPSSYIHPSSSKMARRSLTALDPAPIATPTSLVSSVSMATSLSASESPTLLINTNCMMSSHQSSDNGGITFTVTNSAPKMVEVVVVASHASVPTSIILSTSETVYSSAHTETSVGTTSTSAAMTAPAYKLSEIVTREKGTLFKESTGLELEPPRNDVFSVRRRSRQFFTLREEEETDSSGVVEPDLKDTNEDGDRLHIDPVFNLGESLRRLYFPNEYRQKSGKRRHLVKKEGPETTESQNRENTNSKPVEPGFEFSEYSDPVGCASLYQKVSSLYSLRRVQSQPEMESGVLEEPAPVTPKSANDDTFDYSTFSKSKSLPNTPKVSPKLLRKNKVQSKDDMSPVESVPAKPDTGGAGFSFLQSVAGDVRLYKAKKEKARQDEERKRIEKQAVCHLPDPASSKPASTIDTKVAIATSTDVTTTQVTKPSADVIEKPFRPRSYSNESDHSDTESGAPHLVKKIVNWGMKKKINVTSKEANMWSHTSY